MQFVTPANYCSLLSRSSHMTSPYISGRLYLRCGQSLNTNFPCTMAQSGDKRLHFTCDHNASRKRQKTLHTISSSSSFQSEQIQSSVTTSWCKGQPQVRSSMTQLSLNHGDTANLFGYSPRSRQIKKVACKTAHTSDG